MRCFLLPLATLLLGAALTLVACGEDEAPDAPQGQVCFGADGGRCPADTFCCNETCGTCLPAGETCDAMPCD